MVSIACVVDAKNKLGEVPVWDVREQALYWVDIEGRLLQRLTPSTGEVRRWTMPERLLWSESSACPWTTTGASAWCNSATAWMRSSCPPTTGN